MVVFVVVPEDCMMHERTWTADDEDRQHERLELNSDSASGFACANDEQPWPCAWEQRRRQLAAAMKVVNAALAVHDARLGENVQRLSTMWRIIEEYAHAQRNNDPLT
jgi:hypothetical protein